MKRGYQALLLGGLMALVGLLATLVPVIVSLEEERGLGLLYDLRGIQDPPPEAVIVAINQGAADRLGLSIETGDWPRTVHARMVDTLVDAGAAAIAFDVNFERARPGAGDREFSEAIARADNVVLFSWLEKVMLVPTSEGQVGAELQRLVTPSAPLAAAAAAVAPFPLPEVPIRVAQFWSFFEGASGGLTLPAATLVMYSRALWEDFGRVVQSGLGEGARWPDASRLHAGPGPFQLASDDVRKLFDGASISRARLEHEVSNGPWSAAEQRLLNALIALYSGDAARFANFLGPARTIRTVAYDEVLDAGPGAPILGQFRDKAVFIGYSARFQPEQRDGFYTVYSGADGLDLSGVEIAATAFSNLLNDNSLRVLGPWGYPAFIIFWGLGMGWCLRMLSMRNAMTFAAAAAVVYLVLAWWMFSTQAFWLPVVIPVFVLTPLAAFAALMSHHFQARHERERIRSAFGMYLPGSVVDDLASEFADGHVEASLIHGTCLCTDADHYTALSETMEPRVLADFMNAYYQVLFPPVREAGGVISDVVGDSMLAIWPGSAPDAAVYESCCEAALRIVDAQNRFCDPVTGQTLVTRVGIHAGSMSLGTIGALDHLEYRAVGDIVNTASRIQGLTKKLGVRIAVSEDILLYVGAFMVRELGQFRLAGKLQSMRLYELIGFDSEATGRQRELSRRFHDALVSFSGADWDGATAQFQALINEFDDGPSRFYIARCGDYRTRDLPDDWNGSVVVEK